MAIVMEHPFKQLPADKQVGTRSLLESVSYLLPFFGSCVRSPLQGRFPESTVQEVKEKDCQDKIRLFLVNFTATNDSIYEMYTKMNAEI